jgi:hypothetical protein
LNRGAGSPSSYYPVMSLGFLISTASALAGISSLLPTWTVDWHGRGVERSNDYFQFLKIPLGSDHLVVGSFGTTEVSSGFANYSSFERRTTDNSDFIYFGKIADEICLDGFSASNSCLTTGSSYLYEIQISHASKQFSLRPLVSQLPSTGPLSLILGMNLSSSSIFLSNGIFASNESDEVIQGRFYTSSNVTYEFSTNLFSSARGLEEAAALLPSAVNCQSLQELIFNQDNGFEISFNMISDYLNRFSSDSLPFWLDYCQITLPTLFLRGIVMRNLPAGRNDYYHQIESICNVKDISFISKNPLLTENNFYSKNFPFHCIEDFLTLILFDQQYHIFGTSNSSGKIFNDDYKLKYFYHAKNSKSLQERIVSFHELLYLFRGLKDVLPAYSEIGANFNLSLSTVTFSLQDISPVFVKYDSSQSSNGDLPLVKERYPLKGHFPDKKRMEIIRKNIEYRKEWEMTIKMIDNNPVSMLAEGDVYVLVFVSFFHLAIAEKEIFRWKTSCVSAVCHVVIKYLIIPIYSFEENQIFTRYQQLENCLHDEVHSKEDCESVLKDKRQIMDEYFSSKPAIRTVFLETKMFLKEIYSQSHIIVLLQGLEMIYSFIPPSSVSDPVQESLANHSLSTYCQLPNANFFSPFKAVDSARYYCLSSEITVATAVPLIPSTAAVRNLKDHETKKETINIYGIICKIKTLMMFFNYMQNNYQLKQASESEFNRAMTSALIDWMELNPVAVSLDLQRRIFNPLEGMKQIKLSANSHRFLSVQKDEYSGNDLVHQLFLNDLLSPLSSHSVYDPTTFRYLRNSSVDVVYEIPFQLFFDEFISTSSELFLPSQFGDLFPRFLESLPENILTFHEKEDHRFYLASLSAEVTERNDNKRCRISFESFAQVRHPSFQFCPTFLSFSFSFT